MLKSRPTRSIAYPHLLTFAVVAVAFATGGCGGLDPGANAPPPKAMGRFAAKSASGTFPTYTPAAAACASPSPAIGPPGPLATTVRISGYRACGPFIAGAGRSSFTCTLASGAIGPYRVLAYNGRKDGSHRAKGSVRLNGKRIIGEDSFQHGASAATLVELGSSNTLEVRTEKEHERGEDGRSSDPELTLVVADEGQSCLIAPLAKVTERTSPLRKSFSPANAFAVPELQVFGADL